jgi:hypothetical protein
MMWLVVAAHSIAVHTSIASLTSGIGGNPNSPINIGGMKTDVGTVIVAGTLGVVLLALFCFTPSKDGKGQRNSGLGYILFIAILVGLYAVGMMAR